MSKYNQHTLRPTTHSRNRHNKSTTFFKHRFLVCHAHANLGLDSSGTRFWRRLEHCSTPSQKLVCTWQKGWLIISRWLLF